MKPGSCRCRQRCAISSWWWAGDKILKIESKNTWLQNSIAFFPEELLISGSAPSCKSIFTARCVPEAAACAVHQCQFRKSQWFEWLPWSLPRTEMSPPSVLLLRSRRVTAAALPRAGITMSPCNLEACGLSANITKKCRRFEEDDACKCACSINSGGKGASVNTAWRRLELQIVSIKRSQRMMMRRACWRLVARSIFSEILDRSFPLPNVIQSAATCISLAQAHNIDNTKSDNRSSWNAF